jgi:hypothetical protein
MADKKAPAFVVNAVAKVDGCEYWTRVGVAFANESPEHPYSLVLNPGVSVSGKLVLSVPKAKEEAEAS